MTLGTLNLALLGILVVALIVSEERRRRFEKWVRGRVERGTVRLEDGHSITITAHAETEEARASIAELQGEARELHRLVTETEASLARIVEEPLARLRG